MSSINEWLMANLYPHTLGTADPLFTLAFSGFIAAMLGGVVIINSKSEGFLGVLWNLCFDDSNPMEKVEATFEGNFENGQVKSFGESDFDFREKRGFMSRFFKDAWTDAVRLAKSSYGLTVSLLRGVGYALLAVATIVLALVIGLVASVLIPVLLVIAAVIIQASYIGMAIGWGLNKIWAFGVSVWGKGVEKKNEVVNFVRTQKARFINWWNTPAVEEEVVEVEVKEESSGYTWYQRLAAHILEMDRDLRNQNRNENADRVIAAVEDNNMDIHDLAAAYTDLTSAVINSDSVYDDSSDEIVNGLHTALMNDDGDNVPLDSVEDTEPSVEHIDEIPVGLPVAVGPEPQDETVEMDSMDGFVQAFLLAAEGNRRRRELEVMDMSHKQLRAECKLMTVAVSGNKDTLQKRILAS